jgi:hypothetical protein
MNGRTLHDWIANHEGRYPAYRIRVGAGASPATIGIVTIADHFDAIDRRFGKQEVLSAEDFYDVADLAIDLASDAGWPTDAPVMRVHAIGESGVKGTSFTVPNPTGAIGEESQDGLFSALAAALASAHATIVHQARIGTKSLEIVTESLSHSHQTLAHSIDSMLDAQEDRQDAEMAALTSELLATGEEEPTNPLQEAAADTLRQVLPLLAASQAQNGAGPARLDSASVIQLLEADPALLAELKQDPRLVSLVLGAQEPPQKPAPKRSKKAPPEN